MIHSFVVHMKPLKKLETAQISEGLFLANLSVPFELVELCCDPSAATVNMSLLERFFSLLELLPFKLRRSVD